MPVGEHQKYALEFAEFSDYASLTMTEILLESGKCSDELIENCYQLAKENNKEDYIQLFDKYFEKHPRSDSSSSMIKNK